MRVADAIRSLERAVGPGDQTSDFDLNPEYRPPASVQLRPAAVLIAVAVWGDEAQVVLTKRASHLKHHPGQIAFPGGKLEMADQGSAETAALREAQEEIGLPTGNCKVLGTLPAHQTVTNFSVTPVVGLIDKPFTSVPEPGEVEEAFHVPLTHVLNPENYHVQWRLWRGARRHYFTVPYGPYYIWGATARMLRVLADRAAQK